MIRYVAKRFGRKWQAMDDNPLEVKRLEEEGDTELMSVLAISENIQNVGDDLDFDSIKYKGPLYFDIDVKGNIEKAIESAQTLVENLQDHGILDQYILVYCSGSKGFHILVHQKVFSAGRATAHLPTVYREIALKFAVEGLDFKVYSERKGRMWRVPNFKRDNGKYKVSITVDELFNLDVEKYQEYISSPRPALYFPESISPSSKMKALFKECSKIRAAKAKAVLNSKGLTSEDFKEMDTIPECIEMVRNWEGLKKESHFNDIILQTVTYINASGLEEEKKKTLIADIAKNGKSTRNPRAEDRRVDIMTKLSYVQKSGYKFDCNYMRSVLEEKPCKGCKLEFSCKEASAGSEEGTLGIITSSEGYYRGEQLISTFTLKPVNRFLSTEGVEEEITVGVEVEVMVNGQVQGKVKLTEDAFISKSELMKQTKGFDKAVFIGVDTDAQKLKHNIFNVEDKSQMGDIMETYTSGVMETRKGSQTLVYVEPNFSIDQYKTIGTHTLVTEPSIAPCISAVNLPSLNDIDYVTEMLKNLFQVNQPEIVAQILGWVSACHLRTHLNSGERGRKEFPLMFLTGNAGTGKTQTAGLFLQLHCIDYLINDAAPSLGSITEWALIDTCSSTTTTPRLLDEFNKAKMGIRRYVKASEILKMAWGSQTINRGTISKGAGTTSGRTGARTVSIPISSPLIVCGEQQPTEPAVQQRSCIVPLVSSGRKGREKPFKYCTTHTTHMRQLGKALVYSALRKNVNYANDLQDKYEPMMPDCFEPRAKISYQTLLMGLDFFQDVIVSLNIPLSEEIDELRESLLGMLKKKSLEISQSKAETEMDKVINSMAVMALLSSHDMSGSKQGLVAGMTYLKTQDFLYLDVSVCVAMYEDYCSKNRKICVIENSSSFKRMLDEEDYCLGTEETCSEDSNFAAGRKVAKLSLEVMRDKGLDADYFQADFSFNVPEKFIEGV